MAEINLAEIPESRKIHSWAELVEYCGGHAGTGMEDETVYIMNDIDVYAEYPNDDIIPGLTVAGINIDGLNHTIYNLPIASLLSAYESSIYLDDVPITIKDLTFRNIRSTNKTASSSTFIYWNNNTASKIIHFENVGYYGDIRKASTYGLVYPRYNVNNRKGVFKRCHGDLMCVKPRILHNSSEIVESHFILRWYGKSNTDFELTNPLINTRIDLYNMNDYFAKSGDNYVFPWPSYGFPTTCNGVLFYIHTDFQEPVVITNNTTPDGNTPIAFVKVGKCETANWTFNNTGTNYKNVIGTKAEVANVTWLNEHGFMAAVKE